jgi:hypothetical protein
MPGRLLLQCSCALPCSPPSTSPFNSPQLSPFPRLLMYRCRRALQRRQAAADPHLLLPGHPAAPPGGQLPAAAGQRPQVRAPQQPPRRLHERHAAHRGGGWDEWMGGRVGLAGWASGACWVGHGQLCCGAAFFAAWRCHLLLLLASFPQLCSRCCSPARPPACLLRLSTPRRSITSPAALTPPAMRSATQSCPATSPAAASAVSSRAWLGCHAAAMLPPPIYTPKAAVPALVPLPPPPLPHPPLLLACPKPGVAAGPVLHALTPHSALVLLLPALQPSSPRRTTSSSRGSATAALTRRARSASSPASQRCCWTRAAPRYVDCRLRGWVGGCVGARARAWLRRWQFLPL